MAGVNAYAGRFVGNDFVLPKSKPKKIINTTPLTYREALPVMAPAFVGSV